LEGVEVSSVSWLEQLTVGVQITDLFEEIKILKAVSSKYLFNDAIAGQNDPMYKLLPSSVI
jgi:hypothetical protein